MHQEDIDFLIEQIINDTEAGYLIERARWRKEADKKQPSRDIIGHEFPRAKNANGIPVAMTKPNMVKNTTSPGNIMQQARDFGDGERTSMWKSLVKNSLENALADGQLNPAAVAKKISIEAREGAYTATISPQSVVKLCKLYIQSALHTTDDGKMEYKNKSNLTRRWNQRPKANKRDILMLAKTINSPEFLKELKKLFGRKISDPSSWFKTVEKPNTASRFSDV